MRLWPVAFALFAAALLPIQSALNAATGRALGRPALVVLISLTGSAVFMLGAGAVTGQFAALESERWGRVPWWAWPAGVCGAIFLLSQPVVVPRIGAAFYASLAVTAQIIAAVVLDHFGVLGLPQHDATPGRLLGAALLVAGVVLVARS